MALHVNLHTLPVSSGPSKIHQHEYVTAGNWLQDHYPSSTKILYEIRSYIPVTFFRHVQPVNLMSVEAIKTFQPRVIVLNRHISGGRIWKAPGTTFQDATFVHNSAYKNVKAAKEFFQILFIEKAIDWTIVYESDSIVILEQ